MNATTQIIDILTACGCKPSTTRDGRGVKVNAPNVEKMEDLKK